MRITPRNSRTVLGTLNIERDKIERAEVFFLLFENFLSDFEVENQRYEKYRNKTSKGRNDFSEMKRLLQILRELTTKELESNKKEYKSITLELNRL